MNKLLFIIIHSFALWMDSEDKGTNVTEDPVSACEALEDIKGYNFK